MLEERRLTRESLSLSLLNTIQADGFRGLLDDWGGALDAACELDAFGRERLRHLMSAAGEFDTGGSRDCSAFLSFIDTYELHETAADDSIRVMTMHQAKGLGFDIVLLARAGRHRMSTARSVPMLTGYDANAEPAWVLATPGHGVAEADPVLKTALAEANAASAFESLCLLYVAMTRAKRGLYIVTAYPGKTARTFDQAALLKQMLVGDTKPTQGETTRVDSADVTVLKSYGDTTWYHSLPLRPASTAPVEPLLPTRTPPERIPVCPHLTAVRPSDHDLFEPRAWALFTPERSHRMETGTAVHELLSRVTWLDEVDVSASEERWLAAAERAPEIARDALQHFRHAIGLQALRPVFQRPSPHAEVRTEWRFDTVAEERWITGSFDRVVVERNEDGRVAGASIYDFKTDDVGDGGAVNTRAGHYAPQMRAYRDALAQMVGIPPQRISLTLVFTGAGVVRRIT